MRRKLLIPLLAVLALAGCGGTSTHPRGELIHAQHPSRLYTGQLLLTGAQPGRSYGGRPTCTSQLTSASTHGLCHQPGFAKPTSTELALPRPSTRALSVLHGQDAVNAASITFGIPVAGCYASGPFANCTAVLQRHPGHIVTIATYLGPVARCEDNEPGDAVPSQAPSYVAQMHRAGTRLPCVYGDYSHWTMAGGIRAYLSRAGYVDGRDYLSWMAGWDGNPSLEGFDAHQYASGCCVDLDSFSSTFFSTPKPKPKPPPKVVYNWLWFPHSAPASGMIAGPFNVPWNEHGQEAGGDSNNERSIYRLYVHARALPQSGHRVAYVNELREEAHGLYNRLEAAIAHASKTYNASLHRYGRAAVLKAIYEDQPHVSWSSVNG